MVCRPPLEKKACSTWKGGMKENGLKDRVLGLFTALIKRVREKNIEAECVVKGNEQEKERGSRVLMSNTS